MNGDVEGGEQDLQILFSRYGQLQLAPFFFFLGAQHIRVSNQSS